MKRIKDLLVRLNLRKGSFYCEGFIYVDPATENPCECSDRIKWLRPFFLDCYHKDRDAFAIQMLKYRYPEYAEYVKYLMG